MYLWIYTCRIEIEREVYDCSLVDTIAWVSSRLSGIGREGVVVSRLQ